MKNVIANLSHQVLMRLHKTQLCLFCLTDLPPQTDKTTKSSNCNSPVFAFMLGLKLVLEARVQAKVRNELDAKPTLISWSSFPVWPQEERLNSGKIFLEVIWYALTPILKRIKTACIIWVLLILYYMLWFHFLSLFQMLRLSYEIQYYFYWYSY